MSAANGQVLARGEAYSRKNDMLATLKLLFSPLTGVEITDHGHTLRKAATP